jgi:hypothetical protein
MLGQLVLGWVTALWVCVHPISEEKAKQPLYHIVRKVQLLKLNAWEKILGAGEKFSSFSLERSTLHCLYAHESSAKQPENAVKCP